MTTALITEMPELHLEVTEFDRIECDACGKASPFLDDGDNGTHEAHDTGDWHVLNLDECGCPNLCTNCAEEQCGAVDDSPRLFGMRVV
ncbi:hypothetical protein ABZ851_30690 [Streptomyces sp. NPDC047049]|uniref:hypothetical protein n=1 Tax=Streptomyces sp. NPDC047049 TaxID=3156688 RepID=UPI0033ECC8A9